MNFGIAIERAKAEGIRVDMIINAEDCSISTNDKSAGRRGLAACIFIMKACGSQHIFLYFLSHHSLLYMPLDREM